MDLWLKFYPKDWNGDQQLRLCSLAARGIWASFLEPMHMAIPYGHLLINGAKPSYTELAVIASCRPREVEYCLKELLQRGVASQTPDGVIFSRRMVRDAERLAKRRANGKQGGHPLLVNHPVIHNPPNKDNQEVKPIDSRYQIPDTKKKIAPPANLSVLPEIAEKAGRFLERYPEIYAEERRGAHFQLKPVLHYMAACELVQGWPDEKRLELMFRTFCQLPTSEKMAWPGTPAQFLHLAPEIDVRLRQAGA